MNWRIVGGVLVGLLLSNTWAAASVDQWRAGVAAGPAVDADFSLPPGPSLLASVSYGIAESLDLTLDASVLKFPSRSEPSFGLLAGASYKLDVLRWVPHLGVSAGVSSNAASSPAAVVGAALGLDYLLSRRWSFGGQYRAEFSLREASAPTSLLLARLGFHWGY